MSTQSWARRITNLDELPERFRSFIAQLTSGSSSSAFYIIYVPADQWGQKESNPKLFCFFRDLVVFLEASHEGLTHFTFPIGEIGAIETGRQLLYSWLTVTGTVDRRQVSAIMEYNTVVECDVLPMIKLIRSAVFKNQFQMFQSAKEPDQNRNLIALHNMYSEFAMKSIIPGEKVLGFVYQPLPNRNLVNPEIVEQIMILTDHEIILIRHADKRYEIIRNYIPLSKIKRISLEQNLDGQISLIINRQAGESIVSILNSTKLRELQNFINRFDRICNI